MCGRRLRGVSDGELVHEASYRILLRLPIQVTQLWLRSFCLQVAAAEREARPL